MRVGIANEESNCKSMAKHNSPALGKRDSGISGPRRYLTLLSLVLAGEAIFGLPFHVPRYFRPTFVEVFEVTQTQLGAMGSLYGIVAMFSYFLGGGLADRFSPRGLLAGSLIMTGCSGFYLATIPSSYHLFGLYAFWGMATILPFWSALIRATREWGGYHHQGRAFGLLDGGRGLLAAILAVLALFLFAQMLPSASEDASLPEKTAALQSTILVYTITCFIAAAMIWFCVPSTPQPQRNAPRQTDDSNVMPKLTESSRTSGATEVSHSAAVGSTAIVEGQSTAGHLGVVLRMPEIWLQAVVIIGAYCAFKGIDYFSQYARDIWGWSPVDSAGLSAYSSWMRPLAAVAAGFCADLWTSSSTVIAAFVLTAAAAVSLLWITPAESTIWLLWATILIGSLGIFALRGIYFALLQESRVPMYVTGTAVGVVSFIGYTPEIFMPLLGGMLIDHWNGEITGYHVLFCVLLGASVMGVAATIALRRLIRLQAA